jgi:hypothetical protein
LDQKFYQQESTIVFEDNEMNAPKKPERRHSIYGARQKNKKLIVNVYDNFRNCPFSRYLAVFLDVPGRSNSGHLVFFNRRVFSAKIV